MNSEQERMSRRNSEPQPFDSNNNYNINNHNSDNNNHNNNNNNLTITTNNKHNRSDDRIEEIYRKFKNDTGYVGHGPHSNYDKRQPEFIAQPMLPPQAASSSSSSSGPVKSSTSTTPTNRRSNHQARSKPLHSTVHHKVAADDLIGFTPLSSIKDVLEAIPSASHDFYDPRFAESTDTAPGKSESEDDDDEDEFDSDGDLSSGKKGLDGDKDKLTAKEKNREHAKNTRMRKKNYIESLKESIKIMVDEREKIDRERKVAFSRLQEQIIVRKKVLQEILEYRASGVLDAALWGTLLEENIIFVLPVTPYRSFPPLEVYQGQRYIRGISSVIVDTASFYCMLQTIVPPVNMNTKIKTSFVCNFNKAVLEDNSVMCIFDMKTLNAVEAGCRCDLMIHGMLKAVFSPYNKLIFLELTFDVMMLMQQLRRASGRGDFLVIPNTPYLAQEQPNEGRIITESVPPYRIVYVSEGWQHLFGYRREHILGKTCKILQGEKTEKDKVVELMEYIRSFLPCSTVITNYNSSGQVFPNWIRIFPLYTEGVVTHFLGIMENLNYSKLPPPLTGQQKIAPNQQNNNNYQNNNNNNSNNNNNNHNDNNTIDTSVVKTSRPTTGVSSISLAFRQSQQKRPTNNVPTGNVSMDDSSGPVASALTRRLFASVGNTIPPQSQSAQIPHNKSNTSNISYNPDNTSDDFLFGLLKDFAKDSSHNSSEQNFQTNNLFDNNAFNCDRDQSNQSHNSNGNNSLLGDENMTTSSPHRTNEEGEENNQGGDFYLPNGDVMSDGEESFDENLLSY